MSLADAEAVTNAAGEFMESLGFEIETEDEPVFGSFFKKIRLVFSRTIMEEDLEKLYTKGKKALELKYVDLPTAEQTEKLATASEKMVKSLEGVNEGIVRLDNLLVLKKVVRSEAQLIIQQIPFEVLTMLEKHPKLLLNLQTMYELLTGNVQPSIDDENDLAKE